MKNIEPECHPLPAWHSPFAWQAYSTTSVETPISLPITTAGRGRRCALLRSINALSVNSN